MEGTHYSIRPTVIIILECYYVRRGPEGLVINALLHISREGIQHESQICV